jgi:hypothetical protein
MYRWRRFLLKKLNGLDLKTNVLEVSDGRSLDLKNVFQNQSGVASKRPGNEIMFDCDDDGTNSVAEVDSCTISGSKYWFKFIGGKFYYATTRTGTATSISPSPAIDTDNLIWTTVLDGKLFFVDGTNVLRYFDGTSIKTSSIYERPTAALTTSGGGTGFDYTYTVDNGLGESPACATLLANEGSAETVAVPKNTGPQTLVVGDVVRIYSKATTVAAASKLVATHTVILSDLSGSTFNVVTVAISDTQPQLYTELGLAVNKSAPTGLTGIISHYGRIVGWKDDSVYNAKVSNPHSWPDNSAVGEAFVYGFGVGDGEDIMRCASFRESLYVMKPSNIAVFGGIGPDDSGGNPYSFRRLETNGKGCIGPKSVQTIGEEGKTYLIYLARTGFMATNGNSPVEIGHDIEPQIKSISDSIKLIACSVYEKSLGLYLCFLGAPSSKTCWALDVREDGNQLVGWWKWSDINATCVSWDDDRFLFGTSTGICASERVTMTASDFSDVQHEYVAAASVNASTDRITVAKDYATGTEVKVRTSGTIPGGLTANQTYYAIRISATVIKLATSRDNALAGTAIDLADAGSGTHSILSAKAIDAYYTTNWLHFGTPTLVKKLSKPGFLFNALATQINLTVSVAYDWVPEFVDSKTITIGSTHTWGSGSWGGFPWAAGAVASPKNVGISRRKCRSIRYKFSNSTINQDFDVLGFEQFYDPFRNRGNYAA